jgi:hypothetical protein
VGATVDTPALAVAGAPPASVGAAVAGAYYWGPRVQHFLLLTEVVFVDGSTTS